MLLVLPFASADDPAVLPGVQQVAAAAVAGVTLLPGCARFDGELRQTNSFSSRRTLFGRRENLVEVLLDREAVRPRSWRVQLDTPVRLPPASSSSGAAGRIVRMDATLAADAAGWPTSDTLDVTGALGPLALRVRRAITFRHLGPCSP